jgi:hypothetical protein
MNYKWYRRRVIAAIKRRLGGKPNFKIDHFWTEFGYDWRHNVEVTADSIIAFARDDAKKASQS